MPTKGSAVTMSDQNTQCPAVYDRGPRERPRRIQCIKPEAHEGQHFASWGGSQKWRQHSWSDEPERVTPQPIYIVVRVDDEIEDVQAMLAQLTEFGEQVTLNVGPFRFNRAQIIRKGTVAP